VTGLLEEKLRRTNGALTPETLAQTGDNCTQSRDFFFRLKVFISSAARFSIPAKRELSR
jgi:hypothetical protein